MIRKKKGMHRRTRPQIGRAPSPPQPAIWRLKHRDYIRVAGCTCPYFSEAGRVRIADLGCPVHGLHGSDPGDGRWHTKRRTRGISLA